MFLQQKPLEVLSGWACSCDRRVWRSVCAPRCRVPLPLCSHSLLLCTEGPAQMTMKLWRSCYCVSVIPAPSHQSPQQLPHPHCSSEWSARRVRCHRPCTLSHMTLQSEHSVAYWFARVRYSKLWLAFAAKPAPLHTSLSRVARKFSANCARINQRFLSTEKLHCCVCSRKFVFEKRSFLSTLVSFGRK